MEQDATAASRRILIQASSFSCPMSFQLVADEMTNTFRNQKYRLRRGSDEILKVINVQIMQLRGSCVGTVTQRRGVSIYERILHI